MREPKFEVKYRHTSDVEDTALCQVSFRRKERNNSKRENNWTGGSLIMKAMNDFSS